jgi:lysophospholipase L1-like esterase
MRNVHLTLLMALAGCGSSEPPSDEGAGGSLATDDSGGANTSSGTSGSGGQAAGAMAGSGGASGGTAVGPGGGSGTGGGGDAGKAGSGGGAGQDGGTTGDGGVSGGGFDGGFTRFDCNVQSHPSVAVKIACVGDSITQGAGMTYPAQLSTLLGSGYSVGNFGVGGTDLLKNGEFSYWTHGKLAEAQAFLPNDVVIALGTNDMGGSWAHSSEFVGDYTAMINLFRNLPSRPTVFAVLPPWVKEDNLSTHYTEPRMANEVIPLILQAAQQTGTCVIDVHALTKNHPEYYSDSIHPNDLGYGVIAKAVCGAVLGGCPPK